MSILSNINKTIDDADMNIWYKQEYIPFVLDHIEDVVNATSNSEGFKYAYWTAYAVYLPDVCFPKHISKDACMHWLLDNNKITHDSDNDKMYYTDDFLKDSQFMVYHLNRFWTKTIAQVDNNSKNSNVIYMMPEFCMGSESFKQFEQVCYPIS